MQWPVPIIPDCKSVLDIKATSGLNMVTLVRLLSSEGYNHPDTFGTDYRPCPPGCEYQWWRWGTKCQSN